jgi:hypothetical protein
MFEHIPKIHMHLFIVFIRTVQSLKNVSLKVWEDLITHNIGAVYSKQAEKMPKFNYI